MSQKASHGDGAYKKLIRHTVLTNLGEKMSDDEVDELLKAVDTTSGEINYTGETQAYVRTLKSDRQANTNSDLVRMILTN